MEPVQPDLHRHPVFRPYGRQPAGPLLLLPHLLWCLMLPLLLCCRMIVMETPQSRCVIFFLMVDQVAWPWVRHLHACCTCVGAACASCAWWRKPMPAPPHVGCQRNYAAFWRALSFSPLFYPKHLLVWYLIGPDQQKYRSSTVTVILEMTSCSVCSLLIWSSHDSGS